MSGLAGSARWKLLSRDIAAAQRLIADLGLPPLVARVLAARGIVDSEEARAFLEPSLERDWADPLDIPGMAEAADRVERAIRTGEHIAVFGDFDVDGMSSTCLLTLGLRKLGAAEVRPYIPRRFEEGYGLSEEALARVMEDGVPDLIITVDNGIAAAKEVAWVVSQGVDVVVTDHHEPADLVPEGVPVADPKLDPANPSRELAGAGVALKLVCELGRRLGKPELWRSYTDVATLGTISDMMLLVGENRALVADGIERMRSTERKGIVALAELADADLAQITADGLPFSLVPRLNAAGRMGDVEVASDLLLTDDGAQATELAARLESINDERKATEASMAEEALATVEREYRGGRVIVVAGKGWHEGVKGIVASRIVSRYHVPAILFTVSDGIARGSGRSVGDVDLFHAVEQCSDLLVRFGGHAGAVGVTIEEGRIDEFRERLGQVLSELPAEQFVSKSEVTAIVSLDELSVETIGQLDVLQPLGQGNKKPIFAACGVQMKNRRLVGQGSEHLSFLASSGGSSIPAVMFRVPEPAFAASYDGAVDLVFEAVAETWQGRTRPKLMVKDIIYRGADEPIVNASAGEPSLVDGLFERAAEILARGDYAGIGEAESFNTKIVGVSFEGRQDEIRSLEPGEELLVERQPDNEFDSQAIALIRESGAQLGYLRRQIAAELAPLMDAGTLYTARVEQVTGGEDGRSLGVNIRVERDDEAAAAEREQRAAEARAARERLAGLSADELTDELRARLIGEHSLLPAQKAALDRLAQGRSTLCVMATGRGKSLIFHIHAARTAILTGKASVFVYPLRALVSDQSFHLEETFAKLGLSVRVLTGETGASERDEIFAAIASGDADVILTTPEFLAIHRQRFADTGRIGFVVVDEAHHAGGAAGGGRSAYASLPEVLDCLGGPTALAVTATASDPVAREICRLLSIDEDSVVLDRSVRENLEVVDARDPRDREAALVSIVASGSKCVVYVNSRDQSVSIARSLRHAIPDIAHAVAFYNASLTRSERSAIEDAFRRGELSCIISTSAFGEGVNLPDIRDVVLYHMPFGQVEFNQMSGRAGRDGQPARIHLLFGSRDSRINELILASSAPERNELVALYRALKAASSQALAAGEEDFALTNAELADAARGFDPKCKLDESGVSCGISVFRELGFLETSGFSQARRIRMVDGSERMELEQSIRYLEGKRSQEEFAQFRDWALSSSCMEMLERINRPITPSFGVSVET